ncbi:pyocin knob domain-containing protein [Ligilactobacillus salivarius]|jgi:hypothetical protein|uniref:pyocin knob domain-containing protein n=1 Tax=Ligilactobacillus salivarius TaxID=1624 RepID=UPI0001DD31D7|nr:pyocin knob domain-containing protein [Ligilactobacillus salivarius]EFK80381.1 hypothetical protein HMPREF9269_2201 [Ligilactobacillus salivarius ACS-116-V-Col5a]OQR13038.1 hypothetical protein B6U44_01610 [Ligilactobacillus salivarius]
MAINFEPIFSEMANGPEKIKENFDKVKTIDDGVTVLNQKDTANFKIGKFIGGGASTDLDNLEQGVHTVGLWGESAGSSWPKSQQGSKTNAWGTLLQIGASTEICTQIMMLVGIGMMYRIKTNNVWGPWARVQSVEDK